MQSKSIKPKRFYRWLQAFPQEHLQHRLAQILNCNDTNLSGATAAAATSSSVVAAAAAAVASNHTNSISGACDVSNVKKAAVKAAVAAAENYVNSHPRTDHKILQASQIGNTSAIVNTNGANCDASHTTLNNQQLEVAAHMQR